MNFGGTSLAAPKAASSRVARYSFTARLASLTARSLFHSAPGIERCLLASAAIKLASTANPSPPTSPAAMHVSTTRSLEGAKLCSLLRSCGRIARRSVARPDRRSRPHADHHLQLAPKLQEFSRGQIIQRALRHLDTSQTRLLIGQRLARGVDPHTQIKLRVLVNRHQKCMRIAGKCLGNQFPDLLHSRTHRSLALSRTLVGRA